MQVADRTPPTLWPVSVRPSPPVRSTCVRPGSRCTRRPLRPRSYAGSSAGRDQPALVRQDHRLDPVAQLELRPGSGRRGSSPSPRHCTRAAISALDSPWATSSSTSRSRSVSCAAGGRRRAGAELPGEPVQQPPGDRRGDHGVAAGDHPDRGEQLLRRDVLEQEPARPGPERREHVLARCRRWSAPAPGRAGGRSAQIRRVASIPSMVGIRMSITTTSAAAPGQPAAPPRRRSPRPPPPGRAGRPSTIRNPARSSAWSSTITTRTVGRRDHSVPALDAVAGSRTSTCQPPPVAGRR